MSSYKAYLTIHDTDSQTSKPWQNNFAKSSSRHSNVSSNTNSFAQKKQLQSNPSQPKPINSSKPKKQCDVSNKKQKQAFVYPKQKKMNLELESNLVLNRKLTLDPQFKRQSTAPQDTRLSQANLTSRGKSSMTARKTFEIKITSSRPSIPGRIKSTFFELVSSHASSGENFPTEPEQERFHTLETKDSDQILQTQPNNSSKYDSLPSQKLGNLSTREKNVSGTSLHRLAQQLLIQKKEIQMRHKKNISNVSTNQKSMINTFHRQSAIGASSGRHSLLTSASSSQKNLHLRKDRINTRAYFKYYLNTNSECHEKVDLESNCSLVRSRKDATALGGTHTGKTSILDVTNEKLDKDMKIKQMTPKGILAINQRSREIKQQKLNQNQAQILNQKSYNLHTQKFLKSYSQQRFDPVKVKPKNIGKYIGSNNTSSTRNVGVYCNSARSGGSKTPYQSPFQKVKTVKIDPVQQQDIKAPQLIKRQSEKIQTATKIVPEKKEKPKPVQSAISSPLVKQSLQKKPSNLIIDQEAAENYKKQKEEQKPVKEKSIIFEKTKSISPMRSSSTLADYQVGRKLGEGAYAVVHSVMNKRTKDKLAMKIYDKEKVLSNDSRKRSLSREITLLKKLDHPNIVKLYDTIDTKKSVNLVMENVEGQSLYDYVRERNYERRFLPESDVKMIIRELLVGVNYMHQRGIAHRDLKLDNIIIIDERKKVRDLTPSTSISRDITLSKKPIRIKIIDFGFSVTTERPQKQFCGTPSYMAPEIVKKHEYNPKQTDVWALGVLAYRMLYGNPPYKAPSEKELYQKIIKGSYCFPENEEQSIDHPHRQFVQVSDQAKHMISQMLNYKPEQRPSAAELLKFDWMKE